MKFLGKTMVVLSLLFIGFLQAENGYKWPGILTPFGGHSYCSCPTDREDSDCSCSSIIIIEDPQPQTLSASALVGLPTYIGEDENFMYFTAHKSSTNPNEYNFDSPGPYRVAISKLNIEDDR